MKFLITGVSGFVCEELVKFFEEKPNNTILGIDKNQYSYNSKMIFKKCILLSEKGKIDDIFKEFRPDVVLHSASTILDTYNKNFYPSSYSIIHDLFSVEKYLTS